ncbi:MAG TPA: hypothetical protein VF411_02985 [Bacteroidia bacterium]
MGTSGTSRMPVKPDDLRSYMDNTDDYQLAIVPDTRPGVPPGSTVAHYVLWGWSAVESGQWHTYRVAYDRIYQKIKDVPNASKGNRTTEKLLNKAIHAYDNDKLIGHHLLDKIALNGTIDDCEEFFVKRGTALASPTNLRIAQPPVNVETITIHKTAHLLTRLLVVLAGQKGRAKPKGIKEIMVFKANTALNAAAPAPSAYLYVGDVKRGLITIQHAATDEGTKAWFIAYTKSTKGVMGAPSAAISVTVM